MNSKRTFFIIVIAIGAGLVCCSRDVMALAAAENHAAVHGLYFPPGAVWTQDVSHARLDPHSSKVIAWLTDAGGWGTGKMHVDFAIRGLQTGSTTPYVPFRKGKEFYKDSDAVSTFPLPNEGGIEGQRGYHCPIEREDCHLIRFACAIHEKEEPPRTPSEGFAARQILGRILRDRK